MANQVDETARRHGEGFLASARANFRSIEQFLDHLKETIAKRHQGAYELVLEEEMRRSAANACDVLYSVHNAGGGILSLRFTMVGERADMILFQGHQRSALNQAQPKTGPVDQHVYRMGEMDELKKVVQRRIDAFLA